MNKQMLDALNEHLNFEMNSAYLYLSMSAYFESTNLPGHAHWMNVQYQEEMIHTMKFYRYIFDRGGRVILGQVDTPQAEWSSSLNVFESSLKHEKMITERINNLAGLSLKLNDFTTHNFLQWFLNEQVEEEVSFSTMVHNQKMVQDSNHGLYVLDKDLSARVLSTTGVNGTTGA